MKTLRDLSRYPSAIAGLVIVAALVALAIYTVIAIPYDEAIRLWRGGENIWAENPKNAQPVWVNWFSAVKRPETMVFNSLDATESGPITKKREAISAKTTDIIISFPFDYAYDTFPQDLTIFFTSTFEKKQPYVNVTWITPDGQEIGLGEFSIDRTYSFRIPQENKLKRKFKDVPVEQALFTNAPVKDTHPLQGRYELRVQALVFEENADVDAKFVLYGQVHGLAGTDHRRRDLSISLLWGTPIALAFGLLAALGTTVLTMIIAAVGVWYGGWIDELIQRFTEINMVLPFLPILIMVGTLYNRSIWLMLGVSILLSIFSGSIKGYRSIFLQIKESPYIEAARAYGAGNLRVVFVYLIPRIIPVLIPALVSIIPSFVFLEASLAVLGLGDPVLPTWGKMINDANDNGALFQGLYYWVIEPSALLMLTGLAFAMLGFSLDRIFNPRLRGL